MRAPPGSGVVERSDKLAIPKDGFFCAFVGPAVRARWGIWPAADGKSGSCGVIPAHGDVPPWSQQGKEARA